MTSTHTYSVPTISCEHCVTAISGQVGEVPGVESVVVDVDTKTVSVVGGVHADVVAAIDEAGYDIAAVAPRSAATAEQQIDDGVIRVTKWTFPVGSETGFHVHEFDYLVVPVTSGVLTIETSEGATTAILTPGVSYQREQGIAHNVANDGDTEIVFIDIELLDR